MEKVRSALMYIIVMLLALGVIYGFMHVFAFEDEEDTTLIEDITEEEVALLYSYLPDTVNDYGVSSMYTKNYTTYNNLSYTMIGCIIYDYILNYDPFVLEVVSEEEVSSINTEVYYKISEENFLKYLDIIFGSEKKYNFKDFNISSTLKVKYLNNYLYIATNDRDQNNNSIVYKSFISYTVSDNKETIKIYEYYLNCDKESNLCYDDEEENYLNEHITYSDNLNILDYEDYLQEYVHTFKYEDGNYYWFSSEGA